MGLMQGKVVGDSIVVMDSFALPVQGTETRVNAANEAYEYMVEYLENSKKVCRQSVTVLQILIQVQVGRLENAIGWYHSHPGYGCWLSGIDVNTQLNNQLYQDPFVAVVVRFNSPPPLITSCMRCVRSIPTVPSLLAKSTSELSVLTRKTTRRQTHRARNTSLYLSTRSRTLEYTLISTTS